MAFWIRHRNAQGALVETALAPGPTEVEYPDGDGSKVLVAVDGAAVVQRPLRDTRPRQWVWHGYGPTHASYETLWALLTSLTSRARLAAGLSSTVEVWEDVTGAGGFDRKDGSGNKVYTTVAITRASRAPLKGGGPVFYDSTLEFRVQDASYVA